jgi:hypothetical protein
MGIYQREAARALEASNALRIPVPDLFSQQAAAE